MSGGAWSFWVDRGGTFTDIVAEAPDGRLVTEKLLSEAPGRYDDAITEGIRRVLGVPEGAPLPQDRVGPVRIGTTVATNALLERQGARTLFVVTSGFADLLRIGRQSRPDLFALDIRRPAPLHDGVLEVAARVAPDGTVLQPLDEDAARDALVAARREGFEAVTIALIHSWKHPGDERRLGEIARAAGFETVTLSHQVDPLVGLVGRAATSLVDAYLTPVLTRYLDRVGRGLCTAGFDVMQSNGGLARASSIRGKDAILSGPAGGVVGAARTAGRIGHPRVIGFDMGGTSTDISVYEGAFERVVEAEIAGAPLRVPMMDIHTVAAGGGSVLAVRQGRLTAGPQSAGADPGPAAYRRGGPATLTDANIVLGRIQPDGFPAVFGPDGNAPLDPQAARRAFDALAGALAAETGQPQTAEGVAAGGLRVAVAAMARAIRRVTLEKGRDTDDFALQCFGGAGGQHACLVAGELGIRTIIVHPLAGVLSALGIGLADTVDIARTSIERPFDEASRAEAAAQLDALRADQARRLGEAGLSVRQHVTLRYAGTDTRFDVAPADLTAMRADFSARYRRRYGFDTPGRALILDRVTSEARRAGAGHTPERLADGPMPAPDRHVAMWSGEAFPEVPLWRRDRLPAGARMTGPALVVEATATTVIDAGWQGEILPHGELVLTRTGARPREAIVADAPRDPVLLELFNNLFMAVAERMGAVLRETATSVNIKERLDFSCGVFDAEGRLLANAPHMPVHLGAMGESVRAVLRSRGGRLRPGDMIALNNPYNGGSHLPDITVIAPVFDPGGTTIRFFVANRGHHADVGGTTPGSTPPDAIRLEEEGVVLDDLAIMAGGDFLEADIRAALTDAPWPARDPDANIADLRAQAVANRAGIDDLAALVERYGWPGVSAYAGHVMDNAEESVRRVIDRLGDGALTLALDDGAPLAVRVGIDRKARSATIDFTGTGAQRPGNFNAPPAVTRSAVLYVFRCLVDDRLPLNEGCLRPLRLVIPDGSFLSPAAGAAVVAGNTEVSQAVCNVLLGALGAAAASQGTMNNLLFGNEAFQYYETVCGGAGAGPGFDGASAVHTHMTNTRITDPEVLELAYPLRVERFAIRRGSGGAGRHPGGDGVERAIRALAPAVATLVASSRETAPFGLCGGSAGAPGRQWVVRAEGHTQALAARARIDLQPGDVLVLQTPGGGGHGPPGG